tara:strand:- start:4634 stop:4951 length:318 start_codon:yes stop_codon:yes gene_type:complete
MENKILELKDSVWMLSQPNPMPQELKDLTHDENADDQEKLTAINAWKASRYSTPEAEDAAAAQAIYDENKMESNNLISATVFLPSGNGIINCRQPSTLEHCQIRF